MATMTMEAVKVVSARVVRPRTKARLVLTVDGVEYRVRAFLDETERRSLCDWRHGLTGPDRREFHVYPIGSLDPIKRLSDRRHCTRCGHGSCEHARALEAVGLL